MLGGNGTIEDFSPLPRLYRDAIVFESWEGTHNVLCAQVLRDCVRFGVHDHLLTWTRAELASVGDAGVETRAVTEALGQLEPRLQRSIGDPGHGAAHFRRQLELLVRVVQATCLLTESTAEGAGSAKAAVAALFVRRHLIPGHVPDDDPGWSRLVDEALAGDAG